VNREEPRLPRPQPRRRTSSPRLRDAVGQLERRLAKIAALLDEARPGVLAFCGFPTEHWPKIRSKRRHARV
jgi:transposase-like protein